MNNKFKYLIIILLFFSISFISAVSAVQGAGKRKTISEGQRALAWVEVQNVMSRHNYYHAVNMSYEELLELWVKEDGEYAETATFSQPQGVWQGMDLIKVFYGNPKTKDPKQSIKEMMENEPIKPSVGLFGIHMNTTPVIEIAGDGKTAKGVWYSPGLMLTYTGEKDKDDNDLTMGNWFFEKYAADFIKEDGKWKIWHIQMYYDFTPSIDADWTKPGAKEKAQRAQREAEAKNQKDEAPPADMMKLPDPTRPNPDPYKQFSPTTEYVLAPELPEPYYTFSETFSY